MGKRRPTRQPQSTASDQMAALSARVLQAVTPELLRQHRFEEVVITHPGDGRDIQPHRAVTLRIRDQRLIDRYFVKGLISLNQHAAADRLHEDYHVMHRSPYRTSNLERVGSGGSADLTPRQDGARRRVGAALRAVSADGLAVLMQVVFYDIAVSREAAKGGLPGEGVVACAFTLPRGVCDIRMDALRRALDALVRFYGIA